MARGKGPSRRSMRARLKAISREVARRRLPIKLPAEIPRLDHDIETLAGKLLGLWSTHRIEPAFDLLVDLAGPLVARHVVARLEGRLGIEPEEIVARVFVELARTAQQDAHSDATAAPAATTFAARVADLVEQGLAQYLAGHPPRTAPPLRLLPEETTPLEALLDAVRHGAGPAPVAALPESNPVDLDPAELQEVIARNFETLPELTQRCFDLHLIEGLSLPNVAQRLGLSLAAVSRRMSEARRQAFLAAREARRRKTSADQEPQDEQNEHGEGLS